MDSKYSIRVEWSDEDQGFVAVCAELDDLPAFGETIEKAIAELKIAMKIVIEHLSDEGKQLPPPRIHLRPSGQFRVRLPRSLHAQLTNLASREGVSLNTLVNSYLAKAASFGEAKWWLSETLAPTGLVPDEVTNEKLDDVMKKRADVLRRLAM